MTFPIHNEFIDILKRIDKLSLTEKERIEYLLQNMLDKVIELTSNKFSIKPIIATKRVKIDKIDKFIDISFGVERSDKAFTIAEWILDLQITSKSYLLYYLILKEGLMHFVPKSYKEASEAIINIVALLLFVDLIGINTFDNPALIVVTSRLDVTEINGRGIQFWNSLSNLLISKNIKFENIFLECLNLIKNTSISQEELTNQFSNFVKEKTVKEEDVIAPIYLNSKLINVIESLLSAGYENASAVEVSKTLNAHLNTIRSQFRELTNYSTQWISVINYEKLGLNNYFIKVETENKKIFEKIKEYILSNSYIRTIFQGYCDNKNNNILYSPQLVCPHITAEQLEYKLKGYYDEGLLDSYAVQLIRDKIYYNSLTEYPYQNTLDNFRKLINEDDPRLKKYVFNTQKRDFSMEFDDSQIPIDSNLLFFLSILKGKFLLKGKYMVWVNELPEFYKSNNISLTDLSSQNDFLNQIDIRARKRGFLDYSLFMKNFIRRGSDILIIELLMEDETYQKEVDDLVDKLRIFSFMGRMNLYDRNILTLPGVSHDHKIKDIIEETTNKTSVKTNFYSIKLLKSKFVPYHKLYNFDEQKWI